MNAYEIAFSASEFSQYSGKTVFVFSGVIVILNTMLPNVIPLLLVDASIGWLSLSLIGVIIFSLKYRKVSNPSTKECPRCGSRMSYTGVKCIDEHKKECNFVVKFK